MKATIKVGLDLGASRVKASFKKGAEIIDICFPNRVDTSVTANGIRVNVDNEDVVVGTVSGYSNSINKKINYHNLHHLLFAVAYRIKEELQLVEDTIRLDITTVLPPKEYKESRNEYKEKIKLASDKVALVNGDKIHLILEDVKVGAEGVALLKAYNLDKVAENLTQVLLLDVGSSTTDYVILTRDGERWKIKDANTSRVAGAELCKAIETKLNAGTGLSYSWDDLERQQGYQLDGEWHNLIKEIDATDTVVKELISDLAKNGNVRQYKVILAGGGSRLLKESKVFKEYTKFSCIDDYLLDYGNSRGALKA